MENWDDPEMIEKLNRWRQQVFRYVTLVIPSARPSC